MREAVSGLLESVDMAEAGTFDEVAQLLERGGEVDLILLDLRMPGVRGFSGLLYLRAQYPSVPVIVVSANDDPAAIRRCMEFGASGFIPKTLGVDAMRAAMSRILNGGVWTPPDVDLSAGADAETAASMGRMATLTPQQVRVLMMLSEGLLNKQIAFQLSVSEATVKAHVSGHSAKARRREPHASRDRRRQDRGRPMAARRAGGWLNIPSPKGEGPARSAGAGLGLWVVESGPPGSLLSPPSPRKRGGIRNATPPPPPAVRAIAPAGRAAPPV